MENWKEKRNTQKMRVPFSNKLVPYYSLDVIISVEKFHATYDNSMAAILKPLNISNSRMIYP